MTGPIRLVALALLAIPASLNAQVSPSPHAGSRSSDVPSLSRSEIEDLRSGAGAGFARPAELNGFPGPLHVLELADSLELDEAQRDRVRGIRTRMLAKAIRLGEDLIAAEGELHALFASGEVTEEALAERVDAAAAIQAELRRAHLRAHVETRRLLTRHQIHTYDRLRGYGSAEREHDAHRNAGSRR